MLIITSRQSKKKLGRNRQNAIMFYGEGTFDSTGPSEHGGRPAGCMKRAYKRHFLTRPANVHRTLRSCIHCKEQDVTKEGDHAFCNRCESLTDTRQYMHKDKLGANKKFHGAESQIREDENDHSTSACLPASDERLNDSLQPKLYKNLTGAGNRVRCRVALQPPLPLYQVHSRHGTGAH